MANIISKAIGKIADRKASLGSSTKVNPNDRVIPREPVQRHPSGGVSLLKDTSPGLKVHNVARANKGVQMLEYDDQLAKNAEEYAQELAESGKLEHSGNESEGENLFMTSDTTSYDDAVRSWLEEGKNYGGEKIGEGNTKDCLHFTQCLWGSSSYLGMGKAKSKDGKTYIVARYKPKGNISGGRPF